MAAIARDIAANKPGATLDRLHTYCMKKFSHLLEQRQIECAKDEPLHSRMSKYMNVLSRERELGEVTKHVIRNYIGIFKTADILGETKIAVEIVAERIRGALRCGFTH